MFSHETDDRGNDNGKDNCDVEGGGNGGDVDDDEGGDDDGKGSDEGGDRDDEVRFLAFEFSIFCSFDLDQGISF